MLIELQSPPTRPRQALYRKCNGFQVVLQTLERITPLNNEAGRRDQLASGKQEDSTASSNPPSTTDSDLVNDQVKILGLVIESTSLGLQENQRNRHHFDDRSGWAAFTPLISQALRWGQDSTSAIYTPNPEVLGILLSKALSDDPSLLHLFTQQNTLPQYPAMLPISSNLGITEPELLVIIFDQLPLPYVCSSQTRFDKVPLKIQDWPVNSTLSVEPDPIEYLQLPSQTAAFEETIWRLMLVIVQSSWINLFIICKTMGAGGLVECVLNRLYPPHHQPIEQATTTRRTISTSEEQTDSSNSSALIVTQEEVTPSHLNRHHLPPATGAVRIILFKVLRRLLEAGIHPRLSFRLFSLLRRESEGLKSGTPLSRGSSAQTLTLESPGATGTSTENATGTPPSKRTKPRLSKIKLPALHISLDGVAEAEQGPSVLDDELLETIRHGMTKRWPDVFGFRTESSGLKVVGLDKWPSKERGFYYMVSKCDWYQREW